jgi:hypothetical protein
MLPDQSECREADGEMRCPATPTAGDTEGSATSDRLGEGVPTAGDMALPVAIHDGLSREPVFTRVTGELNSTPGEFSSPGE